MMLATSQMHDITLWSSVHVVVDKIYIHGVTQVTYCFGLASVFVR